jgi:chromosome partitioning protein
MSRTPRVPTPPVTISMLNMKGGVGKTSSCFHLGGVFAERGYRTLLVDMDPQASLTQGLLGVEDALGMGKENSVAGLFDPTLDPTPGESIRRTRWDKLDLLPSCRELNDVNLPRPLETHSDRQTALGDFLREIRSRYDIILIDCPPNLNLCSWNALLASHFAVCPLQCEDYGAQGLIHVLQFVEFARKHGNPRLHLLGFLLTMVSRLSIHKAYEREIRKLYGEEVFTATVPYLTAFKEAISYGLPVTEYEPASVAARAIHEVADEVSTRIQQHRKNITLETT